MSERYPGKFPAIVADNDDPKSLSRVRVTVPEVFGDTQTGWCLPCSPYAGSGVGFAAVPPTGSLVFVEWPAGDTTRTPIWSGAMWADGDGVEGAAPDVLLIVTPAGHKISLAEQDNAVEITAPGGATLKLNDDGVKIEVGSSNIEVKDGSVKVNGGALEVT